MASGVSGEDLGKCITWLHKYWWYHNQTNNIKLCFLYHGLYCTWGYTNASRCVKMFNSHANKTRCCYHSRVYTHSGGVEGGCIMGPCLFTTPACVGKLAAEFPLTTVHTTDVITAFSRWCRKGRPAGVSGGTRGRGTSNKRRHKVDQ